MTLLRTQASPIVHYPFHYHDVNKSQAFKSVTEMQMGIKFRDIGCVDKHTIGKKLYKVCFEPMSNFEFLKRNSSYTYTRLNFK